MKPCVYLAGPITGLDYDGATNWRDTATARFTDVGINALSPLRSKFYLQGLKELSAMGHQYLHVLSSIKGITSRDRYDATHCNLLLVNLLGAQRVSIGTMMELGWADAARIPIVCAMEDENVHQHAMVHEVVNFMVPTLDEAIDVSLAVLKAYT